MKGVDIMGPKLKETLKKRQAELNEQLCYYEDKIAAIDELIETHKKMLDYYIKRYNEINAEAGDIDKLLQGKA